MNKYLVIEGIDGSGKSRVLNQLKSIYESDPQVIFVKSPVEPFDNLVEIAWKFPLIERFMFFIAANSFFSNTADNQKVYILDRFIYSTFITHVDPDNKDFLIEVIRKLNLIPSITILLKVSKDKIIKRLEERNNPIDNSLNINKLYELYYNSSRPELGRITELINENEADLEKNIDLISRKINNLKNT